MDAVLTRLPRYARGLKLVRIGVFIMLAQLALSLVMTLKTSGAASMDEATDAFDWVRYFLLTNLGATLAMLIGSLLAISDFRLAGMPTRRVIVAAAGFAIALAALGWSQHVIDTFVEVALDPDSSPEQVLAALDSLSVLKITTVAKDLAYTIGLISVLRMVQQSAIANDQLALRDDASHLTGLLVVMMVADLFYQLTYGLGGGGTLPLFALLGAVLVGGYWIYCHLRLTRFLENAAYLVNEPHRVPAARVVSLPKAPAALRPPAPTIPAPLAAPSPSVPLLVVPPELRAQPAPRADDVAADEAGEPPRFLT